MSRLPSQLHELSQLQWRQIFLQARRDDYEDRRDDRRVPFFAPVSLRPAFTADQRFSAFSREISSSGIGLLHSMPVEHGEVFEITLRQPGQDLQKFAEVVWCRAAGEGWYLSGCRFIQSPE